MFKFLVYLFLFYTASRFIFGTLLNYKKGNSIPNNSPNSLDEEEIKVKPKKTSSNNNNKKTNSNIGEYVDFEEIK
ncbi:MAG: hypothetical protein K9G64_02990 [Bacteroidia bacterium]|nr:hypothetical protein [Bacteroidia bacterium]